MLRSTCCLVFLIVAAVQIISAAPAEDEIKDLPGLTFEVSFRHYSGYLDGDTDKKLHYWFVESTNNPKTDPVVLWLNGGPGCSSLDGLLNELGPYLVSEDGTSLNYNKYSWNTVANVLFLEAPACVGFSYDMKQNCHSSDDTTAVSNYLALKSFFTKFPEYRKNDFFITGESYGGIYIPTLSLKVVEGLKNFPLNFKGYAIGNGLSSYEDNQDSLIFFGYYHGLFGKRLWSVLTGNCCDNGRESPEDCNFFNAPWPKCQQAVTEALDIMYDEGLNMYNLYGDCLHPSNELQSSNHSSRQMLDRKNLFRQLNKHQSLNGQSFGNLKDDPPCTDGTALRLYLNRADVRKAIHIPDNFPNWDICSDVVYEYYVRDYSTMKPQHLYLIKHVRALIYNGDVDMACNFLGDQWFVEQLGLMVTEKRRMWHENNQVAGFVKNFQNLTFLTIRGSGHMVPQDKPGPSLKMITSFINNDPY